MRWFWVHNAKIDARFRARFEEYGADSMRAYLAAPGFTVQLKDGTIADKTEMREQLLIWLKEQYDRAERRETWLITMEVAITIFVGAELVMSIFDFTCRCLK